MEILNQLFASKSLIPQKKEALTLTIFPACLITPQKWSKQQQTPDSQIRNRYWERGDENQRLMALCRDGDMQQQ